MTTRIGYLLLLFPAALLAQADSSSTFPRTISAQAAFVLGGDTIWKYKPQLGICYSHPIYHNLLSFDLGLSYGFGYLPRKSYAEVSFVDQDTVFFKRTVSYVNVSGHQAVFSAYIMMPVWKLTLGLGVKTDLQYLSGRSTVHEDYVTETYNSDKGAFRQLRNRPALSVRVGYRLKKATFMVSIDKYSDQKFSVENPLGNAGLSVRYDLLTVHRKIRDGATTP